MEKKKNKKAKTKTKNKGPATHQRACGQGEPTRRYGRARLAVRAAERAKRCGRDEAERHAAERARGALAGRSTGKRRY